MTTPPAGWHPDPNQPGQLRYWDGTEWTDHVYRAAEAVAGTTAQGTQAINVGATAATTAEGDRRGNWFIRHKIATGVIGVVGVLVLTGLVAPGEDESATPAPGITASPTPTPAKTPTPTPTPTPTLPPESDGDGYPDDEDDYPDDPDRHTESDRDGDGVPNDQDTAPDDPTISQGETGTVSAVVDGDTIDVRGIGRIRIIGIDTPAQDQCGYEKAGEVLSSMVLGKTVSLVPGAQDDRDRYDRLLRYVEVAGTDTGLSMIEQGLAIARYDSRDGYGAHTREAAYVTADAASPDRTQESCPAPPPPPAQPAPPPPGNCEPSYPGVCIPPSPPDLDCGDISERRFTVVGSDPHGFDGDGDGIGCES